MIPLTDLTDAPQKMANDEHLYRAFSVLYKNKIGFIEIDELRDLLNDDIDSSSEEVANAIMNDVDTHKDDKISYKEFASMMNEGRNQQLNKHLY